MIYVYALRKIKKNRKKNSLKRDCPTTRARPTRDRVLTTTVTPVETGPAGSYGGLSLCQWYAWPEHLKALRGFYGRSHVCLIQSAVGKGP